jgi:hypothetical protein
MDSKPGTPVQRDQPAASLPSPGGASPIPTQLKTFITPLSSKGWPTWVIYTLAVLGVIYLLNPTMGIFEFLPDNLPIVGNIDEGVAMLLVWFGVVEYFQGRQKGEQEAGGEEKPEE